MDNQLDVWEILNDDEERRIWDKISKELSFNPSIKNSSKPFEIKVPYDVYDLNKSMIHWDDDNVEQKIKKIFITCMDKDAYMYALDWQHTCFKYNPRIETQKDNPSFIYDDRYSDGGYKAYFPTFYPNGDYYFFISRDFSWGYLTHPWQNKIWVYGDELIKNFRKYAPDFNLVRENENN